MDGKRAVVLSLFVLLAGMGVYAMTGSETTTGLGTTPSGTPDPDRGSGEVAVALSDRGCPDNTVRDPASLTVVPDVTRTTGTETRDAETDRVTTRGFVLNTTVVSGNGENPAFSLSRSQPDVYTLAITTERAQATPLYTPTCSAETAVSVWGRTPTPPDRLRITLDGTVLVDRPVPDHRVVWSFPRVVGANTTATVDDHAPNPPAPDTDG